MHRAQWAGQLGCKPDCHPQLVRLFVLLGGCGPVVLQDRAWMPAARTTGSKGKSQVREAGTALVP